MKFLVLKNPGRLCPFLFFLLSPILLLAQSRTITGKVTDPDGAALIGVSVGLKGTSSGTVSGVDGTYKLTVNTEKGTLVFSFIGYLKKEVPISGNTLNVTMESDAKGLDEVVVVGYGTQKKSDVTGSIASVSSKKIQEVPVNNAAAALQGRVSGVLVDKGGNRPGDGVRVQIRGRRSFKASSDPLYVIDGIPIDAGIGDLDPDDIESMEVLKDASATAIYGSRGANGVVLITTKRGKTGKISVRYGGFYGIDEATKIEQRMTAAEFVEYRREAQRMIGEYPEGKIDRDLDMKFFSNDYATTQNIERAWESGEYDPSKLTNTNWGDYALQQGRNQDHHISVTAGTEMTKVMFSAGYQQQTGIIKGQDFLRWDARLTIDQQITKNIKMGMVNYFSHSVQNYGSGVFEATASTNPLASPYDTTGKLIPLPANDSQVFNALFDIEGITRERRRSRYLGSFFTEVKLPWNLRYRLNVGIDYGPYREGEFQSALSSPRQGGTAWGRSTKEERFNYNLQNLLYYDNKIGKHSVNVTLLQELQGFRFESSEIRARDFPYEHQKWYNLNTAVTVESVASRLTTRKLASFMGRLNYGFSDRYLLTVSLRADGSSVLAEGHKWAYFPSVALAWRVNEEAFLKGSKVVSDLKLRAGWGRTGNSAVEPYGTLGALGITRYTWARDGAEYPANGFRPDLLPNPGLSWENTAQWNAGIDFGFLNNRISGTIDVYSQKTTALLLDRQIPTVSGFGNITQNVGVTANKGFEIALNTINIETKDFQWRTELMYYANRERIEMLYNGAKDDVGNKWFIGEPISVHFEYKKQGIWQNTPEDLAEMQKFNDNGASFEPGKIRLVDRDGDYRITAEDRYIQGTANPRWIGSMNNNFSYKGWDLSFFLITRQKYILDNNMGLTFQGRYNTVKVDYWTPENPTNAYPRPNAGLEQPDFNGTMYFEDASHIRLRNVSLGYRLPAKVLDRIGIAGFRIYATGQNLFIHAPNFSGLDPEVYATDNNRPVRSPSVRSFLLGVNVDF